MHSEFTCMAKLALYIAKVQRQAMANFFSRLLLKHFPETHRIYKTIIGNCEDKLLLHGRCGCTEVVVQRGYVKKMFLKVSQNS